MEKIITIVKLNNEITDFIKMPDGIKKNIQYHRKFIGVGYSSANLLIREDGTVHYSHTTYKVGRGIKYFLKKSSQQGFTVDPKGKISVWFGGKLLSIPCLSEVLKALDKEWVIDSYLPFITNSLMGKIIAGKITNPHDLFIAILKMYRVKNASAQNLRKAVEWRYIDKHKLLDGIAVAKNFDHYVEWSIDVKGLITNTYTDLIQQARMLDRKIDFKWSTTRVNEEHKKWTKEIMDYESDSMSKEPLEWLNKFEHLNDDSYTLLTTEQDVFKEGKTMVHCVYTNYWHSVSRGNYVIFHIKDDLELSEGLTLGLNYDNKDGFSLNQVYGKYNSSPSQEKVNSVKDWIRQANTLLIN